MKKLSLQVKITLLCTAILTAACVLLTLSSMMFSSHELIGVARQATTVITDYAVSVKEAYNLQPAPTANSGREWRSRLIKLSSIPILRIFTT